MPLNPYSEQERLRVMLASCYAGVQLGFKHLPLRFIIDPPHEYFDAHLARQIAIHIFASRFDTPRRRIVAMTGLARSTVAGAIMTVDNRMDEPLFERCYRRMSLRAGDLFHDQLMKDAA